MIPSILKMKCPCCRKGSMFCQHSIFPLGSMMDMPDRCAVCSQKMELEIGFYYGTGYVSYGLTVGLFVLYAIFFGVVFGFSYKDNSVYWYLGTGIAGVLLLQPWLMRLSRVLYLYLFVRYGQRKEGK
ncbi:MAG: DUF983 domain-containing protein [Bacteroidetes bacterium]|nr:DUF983 domain-containing protein [Bacteroidota bacterium]MBS1630867.1 DUF983 domain-containing protein [Bacteroidota bacterium]